MDGERRDTHGHRAVAAQEGGSARHTHRVVAKLRKPHGQHGEVAIFPLVDKPGAVFMPRTRVWVVDEARRVIAGPLVVARRRAYHREWLLGFEGITSRAAVESWRAQFVAVDDADADD